MQVKAIPAPQEARSSGFPSSGFFVSTSRNVASHTMDFEGQDWQTRTPNVSAWVAVPIERDVLIAACFVEAGGETAESFAAMSDDEVREWAVGAVLAEARAARREIDTEAFRSGYRLSRDPGEVEFFAVVAARIDEAFGFAPPTAGVPAVVPPAPQRPESARHDARSGRSRRRSPVAVPA
ncbi:hypothetical protein ACIB24_17060 [Spongisporangium articulatum]|uniref:GAF domain-containing protein n=1 Tax=Spongisporangium articulatum TaxID=3362603 RepID=A0ABW8AR06_9ACTN